MDKIKLIWTIIVVLMEVPIDILKRFYLKHTKPILLVVFGILVYFITMYYLSTDSTIKAMEFKSANYPTLECTANSGMTRVYEKGKYTIGKLPFYGWNVWWTDLPQDDSTSFHVNKCKRK